MIRQLQLKLTILLLSGIAFVSNGQTLFSENFATASLPSGWTNDSLGLAADHVWIFDNAFNRLITGAGFDANYAIFDSDEGSFNDNVAEDGELTTPDINISTASTSLFLELDEQYKALGGPNSDGSLRKILYSTDAGVTWVLIVADSMDYGFPDPAVHSVYDISSIVGVATTVRIRFYWTGTWDWWWAIDNVQLISRQACSAPPNAGTATSTLSSVCPPDSFNLSLTGQDVGIGLTYQWQSSPDNSTWTDIGGATSTMYRLVQTNSYYYRCGLTCSGQTAYSASVQVLLNPPTDCYCIPPFVSGCDVLEKVIINTLHNDSTDCNGFAYNYINYPDTGAATTSLEQNHPYQVTIASGAGTGMHGAAVWFDFNHNGSFHDLGEFFRFPDTIPENSNDFTITIIIPAFAQVGATRMRVRYMYQVSATINDDCTSYDFGETEDYTVQITLPVGISEHELEGIVVYPSPASDFVHVEMGRLTGQSKITLYDLVGNELKSELMNNQTSITMALSEYTNGMYFMRIENEAGTVTKRVLLNK